MKWVKTPFQDLREHDMIRATARVMPTDQAFESTVHGWVRSRNDNYAKIELGSSDMSLAGRDWTFERWVALPSDAMYVVRIEPREGEASKNHKNPMGEFGYWAQRVWGRPGNFNLWGPVDCEILTEQQLIEFLADREWSVFRVEQR